MKKYLSKRIIALILVVALIAGFAVPINAASGISFKKIDSSSISADLRGESAVENNTSESTYKSTDMVRVSIVLEEQSTLQAGYSTMGIGQNEDAMAYNEALLQAQQTMEKKISARALNGKKLDVVWNMTLVGNIISANVPYGALEAIAGIDGVKSVCIEQRYEPDVVSAEETDEPQMYISGGMIGSHAVWANGYTGAGSRIAIIDTGSDTDHQSLDNGAFLYALEENAKAADMSYEAYVESLNLLDAEEIASVASQLNAYKRTPALATGEKLYINEKLAFGYNYIDTNLNITHDFDEQGEHGSHVAGIATANRYIPSDDGYVDALESVYVAGVAPDAQLITMKVFGEGGGAYDSDYMAAIEDAIILGCDVVNLSLGSGNPGASYNDTYADLLSFLESTDTVVSISAGNSGYWAENAATGYLYNDGVSFATNGSPGSYTNAFTVASVTNVGSVSNIFSVGDIKVAYTESTDYGNAPFGTLDTSGDNSGTEYDYIFVDGFGVEEDFAGIDLAGKIVFCSRGTTSFFEKANIIASHDAAATVIYNNAAGTIGLNLTGYTYSAPCVSILQSEGNAIREASAAQTTEAGVTYYTGKMTVYADVIPTYTDSEYYTMSTFSSWGVPGNLSMKPEITAPGGSIYSINGVDTSGKGYELMSGTSMAAPQVTGMVALVAQYLRETGLTEKTGMTARALAQSLLMSTAEPMFEEASDGGYYSILTQGAGLAHVDLATSAESYVLVDGTADGKVKVELGDDPDRDGVYSFSFSINNLNGKEMTYSLSGDLFTQDVFSDSYGNLYLDTWTRSLPAQFTFTSNDTVIRSIEDMPQCDLNGDGVTDAEDAQYLLDKLIEGETEWNPDADVNGDGTVNTYDAHVLLALLESVYTVTVPADGSATIDVTLTLPESVKEFFDAYYVTGAYIEAFVYADAIADEEGVTGVGHSIPVLGYYGSWSESSMFDVGTVEEYISGAENRVPYLYASNSIYGNAITLTYPGYEESYFTGNPMVASSYLPERNAINTDTVVNTLRFALIRNAADSKLVISNTETGEIYLQMNKGELNAAYYYTNGSAWKNTGSTVKPQWNVTDANGEPLPEGTPISISFIAAPEYYRVENEDGTYSIDWDALEEGAYYTTTMTVDNTAPEIKDITMGMMDERVLNVVAQDNQYVAAVALLDASGETMIDVSHAEQAEAGTAAVASVSLDGIAASRVIVAVYDYAMNVSVYEVELASSNVERPYFTAIDMTNVTGSSLSYVGFDTDGAYVSLANRFGRDVPAAAAYADGYVFEVTVYNDLYVAKDDNLGEAVYLRNLDPSDGYGMNFIDLAYNQVDGNLYGLFASSLNNYEKPFICSIDPLTGAMRVIGIFNEYDFRNLTIDENGQFYSITGDTAALYVYDIGLDNPKLIGKVGEYTTETYTSLAWDANTDRLYWAYQTEDGTALLQVNTETGKATNVADYDYFMTGLYTRPVDGASSFDPTDRVFSVSIDPESAATLKGSSVQLNAQVWPWNVTDRSVIWSSDDESIATVDQNGMVVGVGEGTTRIKAASALDPTIYSTCEITVSVLEKELNGIVWDENGSRWWSEFSLDSLPEYTKLTTDSITPVLATASYGADGKLYAASMDTSNGLSDLYTIDTDTFEATMVGGSSILFYADMAYSPSLSENCMIAVYGPYVLLVDTTTGEYITALAQYSNNLVGVAYYGSVYNSNYGAYVDMYLLIDENGNAFLEGFINLNGTIYYFYGKDGGFVQNLGYTTDYWYFNSAYYDGEYLYWSCFNEGDNVVKLLAWDCEDTGSVFDLGNFADGVWPVGGLFELMIDETADTADSTAATALVSATVKGEATASLEVIDLRPNEVAGSLNAVTNVSNVRTIEKREISLTSGKNVSVPLTENVPVTNGFVEISYDPDVLNFEDATSQNVFAYSEDEGKIILAYASANELPAESDIASLNFNYSGDSVDTVITVKTIERNAETVSEDDREIPVTASHVCPSAEFSDLSVTEWYHQDVDFVLNNGLMQGMDESKFSPNSAMTRAQLATVLYRMAGEPSVDSVETPFVDVGEGDWFAEVVAWAYANGIVTGVTAKHFMPNQCVSREQIVVMLARFSKLESADEVDLSAFTDADSISPYAVDAVAWAVENDLIQGFPDGTFRPQQSASRAQVAAIIARYCQNILQ